MIDKKWAHVIGLAMSLPSTIFVSGLAAKYLMDEKIVSPAWAAIIFLAIVGNTLFVMVWYAIKIKDKSK